MLIWQWCQWLYFCFSDITLDLEKIRLLWFIKFLEDEYQEWPPGGDLDVNEKETKTKQSSLVWSPGCTKWNANEPGDDIYSWWHPDMSLTRLLSLLWSSFVNNECFLPSTRCLTSDICEILVLFIICCHQKRSHKDMFTLISPVNPICSKLNATRSGDQMFPFLPLWICLFCSFCQIFGALLLL